MDDELFAKLVASSDYIYDPPDHMHWLPLVCEGVINFVLICDVSIDIGSQGWKTKIQN